jgi:Ni,Fe-hydrogenase III small subunit/ferredoxin
MFERLLARLEDGPYTAPFPPGPGARLPERFRGRPVLDPSRCRGDCGECAARSPSELLRVGPDGRARLDVGACLFAPEEAAACPHGALSFTNEYGMAGTSREALVSDGMPARRIVELDQRARRLFGRSLRLRSVAAGSCNGCEAELVALSNVVFDLARFGVQFVASPRHADGIVLTGAVSRNMESALRATWDATPPPKLVIAVGACAITGGPFRGSPEVLNGAPTDLKVDLWIPGCPPHPLTLLDGLLGLLGRVQRGER